MDIDQLNHSVVGVGVTQPTDPVPGVSGMGKRDRRTPQLALEQFVDGMTIAQKMIKDVESSRSRVGPTKGGYPEQFKEFLHSAFMDEEYFVYLSLCKKITSHEYVDFARLLP